MFVIYIKKTIFVSTFLRVYLIIYCGSRITHLCYRPLNNMQDC